MSIADLLLLLLIAIDIVAMVSMLNCYCFSIFVSCVHFFGRKAPSIGISPHSSPVVEKGCEAGRVGAGRGGTGFGEITWFSRGTDGDQWSATAV